MRIVPNWLPLRRKCDSCRACPPWQTLHELSIGPFVLIVCPGCLEKLGMRITEILAPKPMPAYSFKNGRGRPAKAPNADKGSNATRELVSVLKGSLRTCVGCGEMKPHRSNGLCSACYQWKRYVPTSDRPMRRRRKAVKA